LQRILGGQRAEQLGRVESGGDAERTGDSACIKHHNAPPVTVA
jgi:hypothetical protein